VAILQDYNTMNTDDTPHRWREFYA
jgi:hypothetical protein